MICTTLNSIYETTSCFPFFPFFPFPSSFPLSLFSFLFCFVLFCFLSFFFYFIYFIYIFYNIMLCCVVLCCIDSGSILQMCFNLIKPNIKMQTYLISFLPFPLLPSSPFPSFYLFIYFFFLPLSLLFFLFLLFYFIFFFIYSISLVYTKCKKECSLPGLNQRP